jgi:hypothetical protein
MQGSLPFQDFETEWVSPVIKVRCVAFKLSNDNNETEDEENSSDSSNLDSLLKSMSFSFFIDSEPSLKLL